MAPLQRWQTSLSDRTMPTVEQNRRIWNVRDWTEGGEEWSSAWGDSSAQWQWTIFPRIAAFLPAGTILEIAPGYGRWTHYLKDYCDELIGVDLSRRCVRACQRRF